MLIVLLTTPHNMLTVFILIQKKSRHTLLFFRITNSRKSVKIVVFDPQIFENTFENIFIFTAEKNHTSNFADISFVYEDPSETYIIHKDLLLK